MAIWGPCGATLLESKSPSWCSRCPRAWLLCPASALLWGWGLSGRRRPWTQSQSPGLGERHFWGAGAKWGPLHGLIWLCIGLLPPVMGWVNPWGVASVQILTGEMSWGGLAPTLCDLATWVLVGGVQDARGAGLPCACWRSRVCVLARVCTRVSARGFVACASLGLGARAQECWGGPAGGVGWVGGPAQGGPGAGPGFGPFTCGGRWRGKPRP